MNPKVKSQVEVQVIIQARMGSTRLPGKVLKMLNGNAVLWHVVKRAGAASLVNRVVVATTENDEDRSIVDWCKENSILCVTGSSEDVLARYIKAANEYPAKTIVRITADCPLVDPGTLDALISLHNNMGADYTSNVLKPTYPAGLDAEVVDAKVLTKVNEIATLKSHREHVTMYIRENLTEFKTASLVFGRNVEHVRLTLDRAEDYEVLSKMFALFSENSQFPSIYEILAIAEAHPEIISINSKIDRYEGMIKSAKNENRNLNL